MNLAQRIRAAQADRPMESVEVPQWPDDDGKPTVIYFTDVTVGESIPLAKAAQEGTAGNLTAIATVIVEKALNENGARMFDRPNAPEHIKLLTSEPVSVVMPIFEAMMKEKPAPEKN